MQIMGDFLYVNLFDHHRSRWKKYQIIFQSYIARGCHHLRFFQSRKAKSFYSFRFQGDLSIRERRSSTVTRYYLHAAT